MCFATVFGNNNSVHVGTLCRNPSLVLSHCYNKPILMGGDFFFVHSENFNNRRNEMKSFFKGLDEVWRRMKNKNNWNMLPTKPTSSWQHGNWIFSLPLSLSPWWWRCVEWLLNLAESNLARVHMRGNLTWSFRILIVLKFQWKNSGVGDSIFIRTSLRGIEENVINFVTQRWFYKPSC